MDKEYLKNKIEGLRHHFVESTIHERAIGFYDEAHMTKKMLKIKKKLVVTKTDQKIAELKQQFETCCQER